MYPTIDLTDIDPALLPQKCAWRNKAIPDVSCIESHFPAPTFEELLAEDLLYVKRENAANSKTSDPIGNWIERRFNYSNLGVPEDPAEETIHSPDETPEVSPTDSHGSVTTPPSGQITEADKLAEETWEWTAFLDLKAYYEGYGIDLGRFGVLYGVHPHIAWHFYKSVNKAALHVVSAHASITRVLESLDLKRMSGISPVSIDALENAFSLFCDGLTRHYLESLMPVPQGYFACLCGNFWEAYGVVRFELANVGF